MQQRSDTAARAQGMDARLEALFAWLFGPGRFVLIILGGLLLVGAIAAGTYEYLERRESRAQLALSQIEEQLARAMGSVVDAVVIPEPANEDLVSAVHRAPVRERSTFDLAQLSQVS
jgi:hypothetical protein